MDLLLGLLGLFTGPLGKFFIYGGIIVTLLLAGWGWLKEKEHAAAEAALVQFNAQQLAQSKADLWKAQAQLTQVNVEEADLSKQVDDANSATSAAQKALDDWIAQSKEVAPVITDKKTGKVTCGLNPVYNETLKRLRGK
jgi:hypothetical protein